LREFPEAGHRIRKRSNVRALVERPIIIVHALKADRIEVLRFSMVREVGRKSVKLLDLTVNSRTNRPDRHFVRRIRHQNLLHLEDVNRRAL
jgi:hypothetical protein